MFGSILAKPWYDEFLCYKEDDDDKPGKKKAVDDDDDDDDEDDDDKPKSKTYSQEQVNQIASKEKKDGKRAAVRELLEELGLEKIEDLKAIVTKHADAEEADKTETQKEKERAAREASAAEDAKKEAARDRRLAKLERMLSRQGVPDDKIDRAVKNLEVDQDEDLDDDEIKEAIETLKGELPTLFEESDDTGNGKNPPSPKQPKGKAGEKTSADKAKDLIASRHPQVAAAKKD